MKTIETEAENSKPTWTSAEGERDCLFRGTGAVGPAPGKGDRHLEDSEPVLFSLMPSF